MEIQRRISDSTLLMMVMGLPKKAVYLDESDVQRHELHWGHKFPDGFEVMVNVIVTRRELYTYIDADTNEYQHEYEFEDVHLYYSGMPIATDEQIKNIVIPQLETLIELS